MLRGIHKASSTWLGKTVMAAVMGVLVVSFAIWGIADIFNGFGRNAAIKIGDTEISIDQFRQLYSDRLQQLSRQFGRPIAPDQARALGLDRRVVSQLVAETTFDQESDALRLGISNDGIASRITGDPEFKGINGQFDRARFEQIVREAGFTESRFVSEQRKVILRRQLAQSISGEIRVPQTALTALNQYANEKRTIEYLALGPAQAGDIPAPAPDTLEKYFEERKVLFRAPEYRKLTLLSLTPADAAKPGDVSDADAKAYYEQHKANYGTPEKREVRQIVFPNADDARAASERIAKDATFDDIVKERNLTASDTDLGMVAKSAIIDPAVANAAFSLKPGVVSEPVKGQFGTVLLLVGKIEPGTQQTYDEVAQKVKVEIAIGRGRAKIGELRDKFEDERAAGSTLAEAAKKLGLHVIVIDAVDRSGRGPDGKQIATLPTNPDVVSAAFSTDVGVDNDPLQLPTGGFLWYDVTGIIPAHDRPLSEVKDQVEAHWRDDEVAKRLQAKADDMLGKLKAGTSLAQIAAETGLQVQTAGDLLRGKQGGFAPAKLVEAAFNTPKGVPGTAEGDKETERFSFVVTAVEDPKLDPASAQAKQAATQLQNSYADDLIGEYLVTLENKFGVTINQQALDQVLGGSTQR